MPNPTPKFIVEIDKDHKLPLKEMELFHKYVSSLWPGRYELIIKKPSKPKSEPQRKYYWGVIIKTIALETSGEATKFTSLEIHSFCKSSFLPMGKSSTEMLTTVEEEQYHTAIRAHFASEYGIIIPEPNQVDYE